MAPGHEIVARRVGRRTRVWAERRYLDALVEAGIATPAAFIKENASGVIDDVSKSTITSILVNLGDTRLRLAAKEYLPRGRWCSFKNLFRYSKAVVELARCARLARLGLPVPAPVAAVEIRSWRILKKAYLFTGEIVGGKSLLALLDAGEHAGLGRAQLGRIIDALARTVALAHSKGLFHGDLNASHLILKDWSTEDPQAYLMDFENSRIRRKVTLKERLRDLARLERSASYFLPARERLRFLKSYASISGQRMGFRQLQEAVKLTVARRSR